MQHASEVSGGVKSVLFVCVENTCRSQMAEGLATYSGKDIIKAYSAGSHPAGTANPGAVKVMSEIGIDISSAHPKGFDSLPVKQFDYVVTLGCDDRCPLVPAGKHIPWLVEDPKGKPLESFREIRDQLKEKIEKLLKDISGGK